MVYFNGLSLQIISRSQFYQDQVEILEAHMPSWRNNYPQHYSDKKRGNHKNTSTVHIVTKWNEIQLHKKCIHFSHHFAGGVVVVFAVLVEPHEYPRLLLV